MNMTCNFQNGADSVYVIVGSKGGHYFFCSRVKFFMETNYILVHSFNTIYVKDIRREICVMSCYTALKTGKNGTVFGDNFASS